MKFYSDYSKKYVQDICDALNSESLRMRTFGHSDGIPYSPENFESLTIFLHQYVVMPAGVYYFLSEKGLVNTGRCPFTGTPIDNLSPTWTYMRSRRVHVSKEGLKIMQREDDEDYEKLFGKPAPKRKSSACYIATACYGDEFAPEVIAFRRYRDSTLNNTWYGILFIHLYYLVSPYIARTLRNNKRMNTLIKASILDRIVKRINNKLSQYIHPQKA
jgi:hypothetical protein